MIAKPQTRRARWALDAIKQLPCAARPDCSGPVDPAHIRSRGAGGPDEPWNLLPLCRKHHSLQHAMGWGNFTLQFPQAWEVMVAKGWEWEPLAHLDIIRGKLVNAKLRGEA